MLGIFEGIGVKAIRVSIVIKGLVKVKVLNEVVGFMKMDRVVVTGDEFVDLDKIVKYVWYIE